ncbi:MAG: hypothetical protein AAFN13_02735, partial [Bacteroidota bacterium]
MPDSLDSVRALYREPRPDGMTPTPESLSDTARAEVAALAPVKAALDARPRSGPDADTLAAVLSAARAASRTASDSATASAAKPRASDRAPVRAARRSRSRIALPVLALFACVAIGVALVAQQAEELPSLVSDESAAPMAAAVPSAEEAPSEEGDAALLAEAPTEGQARGDRPVAQPSPQARQVAPTTEPLVSAEPEVSAADDVSVQSDLAAADAQATDVEAAGMAEIAAAAPPPAARAGSSTAGAPTAEAGSALVSRTPIRVAQPGLSLTATSSRPATATWDSPSDEELRLLSLRLQSLRESNQGLIWDEPPVALSVTANETLRARDLISDTAHDETRVGFHAAPAPRTGFIRVQPGDQ